MHSYAVPSETQPLLARKAERNVFTTRRTLGVFATAACGVLGIAALQRGRLGAALGARHESPDEALKVQSEALMASHEEGLALMGDLQVRPFVQYEATSRLGSSSYQQCVGRDTKPVAYESTDPDVVRQDLVFNPTTFSEDRQSAFAVTEFGKSAEDVASIECKTPPPMIFSDVDACAVKGACDDECLMPVPGNCEPDAKDFGSCTPTVASICSSLTDTFTMCNSASSKVKNDKKAYNNIDPGLSPCDGKPKFDAAAAQQVYKTALNDWANALNDATEVCTVGHGLWMYNTEMYETHYNAMVEITRDLQELCSQDDRFDFDTAIAEAKRSDVPTVRRRHLVWLQELCEPTISALDDITDTLKVVTPELQCFAETCQSKITAEADAFNTLKQAHESYKNAFKTYKNQAEHFNAVVDNKIGKKEAILSELEIFQSDRKINAPIFDRDLTNFMRFDEGSDQGHCGLTECQVKSVCHSQIEKDFASFIKSDTCEAVPVSLDKICAPPPPTPPPPTPMPPPPAPGVPPVPELDPFTACQQACAAEHHCCNIDIHQGSNQRLSCLQACMVVTSGTPKSECLGYCNTRSCSHNINGMRMDLCRTCDDVPAHGNAQPAPYQCSATYGSNADTCVAGCEAGESLVPAAPPPAGPTMRLGFNNKHDVTNAVKDCEARGWPKGGDKHCVMNAWDISKVTDFGHMLRCSQKNGFPENFNQDISKWDTSRVTDMNNLFAGCSSFNQDLSGWDVSKVRAANGLFSGCTVFNADISSWNPASATNWEFLFNYAFSFNQDLTSWRFPTNYHKWENFFRNAKSFKRENAPPQAAASPQAMANCCSGY